MARRQIELFGRNAFVYGLVYASFLFRIFGFSWEYFCFAFFMGAVTQYVDSIRKYNKFEQVGSWLWPWRTILQTDFKDNSHQDYSQMNMASLFPTSRDAIINPLGIYAKDLREARDGSTPLLPDFDPSKQMQIPLPPPPEKDEVMDDIELLIGVNPRSKVKYRGFLVIKPDNQGLAGQGYCTQNQRRGRTYHYLHLHNARYLGTHYVDGFGAIRLLTGIAGVNHKLTEEQDRRHGILAENLIVALPMIRQLQQKVREFNQVIKEKDFYKSLYERLSARVGGIMAEKEYFASELREARLPNSRERIEHEIPRLPITEQVSKLDFRVLALFGVSAAIAYAIFDTLTKPTTLALYPFLSPTVVGLACIAVFGLIFYFGRKKFL